MPQFSAYRQHVEDIYRAALAAAEPGPAVHRHLRRDGSKFQIGDTSFDPRKGRIFLVSVGKAAPAMAEAALQVLGDACHAGCVIGKQGGAGMDGKPSLLSDYAQVQVLAGDHPVSGEASIEATAQTLAMLQTTTADDLVLCLVSGGASALLTQPIISLSDWQALINALLSSGCTINELNTVRRQLDRVKGGGLARLAAPAPCVSLILSDVVGNPLEAIGSGPTVLVNESAQDAQRILDRYDIGRILDPPTFDRIIGALVQQPGRAEKGQISSGITIIGDVAQAARAAEARAEELGFTAQILTVHLEGEAREVGRVAAAVGKDTPAGHCLLLAGETTVTVRGDGMGGRNLETALAAAMALDAWPNVAIASVATDGEDGPTTAAGAVVAGWILPYARSKGLSARAYLERNDSFSFFAELDALVRADTETAEAGPACLISPGSTGTNVNDLLLVMTY